MKKKATKVIVIVLISMFQMNSAVQQPDQSPLTRTFDSIVDIHFLTLLEVHCQAAGC